MTEKNLTWELGKTPYESKLLYYWNGTTGGFIDYENPENSSHPADGQLPDPNRSGKHKFQFEDSR